MFTSQGAIYCNQASILSLRNDGCDQFAQYIPTLQTQASSAPFRRVIYCD